jgi:hypothetical protein
MRTAIFTGCYYIAIAMSNTNALTIQGFGFKILFLIFLTLDLIDEVLKWKRR